MDPFVILPDACSYVDHQVLKLQEPPDMVPNGEMPRHVMLSVERSLVDRVSPGTRVHVLGVSSIFNSSATVSHMFRVCFGYCQCGIFLYMTSNKSVCEKDWRSRTRDTQACELAARVTRRHAGHLCGKPGL